MKVVVTGAAGYIGGQIALQLSDAGYDVTGIDRAGIPHHLLGVMKFLQLDIGSDEALRIILSTSPDAIIHCAGTSLVGPSIVNPSDYYENNFVRTKRLLDLVVNALPKTRIIFSSSAAVYGTPQGYLQCQETDACRPISPYGESKHMVEQMLASYHRAYGLDYVAFRYFNACGADPQSRHGQANGATHIIARVLESIRDGREFVLNGTNYDTVDGTCVRDYVHVADIARAHVLALSSKITTGIYNLGSNKGTSNQQIISAAELVTNKKLAVVTGNDRPGDPAVLVADSSKFDTVAPGWKHYVLDDMIQHAWNWYV